MATKPWPSPVLETLDEALDEAEPCPTLVWGDRIVVSGQRHADARYLSDDLRDGSQRCVIGVLPREPLPKRLVVLASRSKELTRMRLAWAMAQKRPMELWLAGGQGDGIKSLVKLLGEDHRLRRTKRRCRVASVALEASTLIPEAFELQSFERHFTTPDATCCSLPGTFAHGRFDAGSELLLSALDVLNKPPKRVADVGAGAGVLGVSAAKRFNIPATLCDVSAIAVASAKRTVALSGVGDRVDVRQGVAADLQARAYDLVLTNPPRHDGRAHAHQKTSEFVRDAARVLKGSGTLLLVTDANALAWVELRERFARVEEVTRDRGYRVIRAFGPRNG